MKRLSPDKVKAMHEDYLSGMDLKEVANRYGYASNTTVLYHFQRAGLKTRPRGGAIKESQKGSENGHWKGGVVKRKNGYVYIWNPGHPNADKTGYVPEHRLVAEKKVGRSLRSKEVVHHINGKKDDNLPSNLFVCTQNEHINIHRGRMQ